MMADLRSVGNLPLDSAALTRTAITGAIDGSKSRSKLVGIGSREQDALDAFLMMDEISPDVVSLKFSNFDEDGLSNVSKGGQFSS